MLHLTADRLAELGDELPSPAEAAHLALCAECAREREAYRSLVALAQAERHSIGLPLTRWDAIAAELSRPAPAVAPEPVGDPRVASIVTARGARRWPLQAAAGLLLMAGGMMAGRASAGATPIPGDGPAPAAASVASAATSGQGTRHAAGDSLAFASVEEARAAQQRYEQGYQQAAAFLAEHDSSAPAAGSPVAVKSRLAALDKVASIMGEATRQAPHDPVINGYYLTTLGQREATLRQLNTSLPASLRVNSF